MRHPSTRGSRLRAAVLLGVLAIAAPSVTAVAGPRTAPAAAPTTYMVSTLAMGPLRQNPYSSFAVLPGRDVAASVAHNGRSYWFFGDTFMHTAPPSFINNSAAVTSDLDATDGITVTSNNVWTEDPTKPPVPVIEASKAELAFQDRHAGTDCSMSKDWYCGTQFAIWPGAPVVDAARNRLLVMYTKICRMGAQRCNGAFVGDLVGAGIAAVDLRTGKVSRLTVRNPEAISTPEGRDPALLFGPSGVAATAFVHGNHYYSAHDCNPYTFQCKLGRAPLAAVHDRRAWQFYAGTIKGKPRWTSHAGSGVLTVWTGAAGGSIQWVPGMKQWLAIYTVPYADDIVYRLAPQPWGPWGPAQRLITALESQNEDVPNYAAFAHAEYAQENGMVQYVTYYHSGPGEVQLVRVKFCPTGTPVCL